MDLVRYFEQQQLKDTNRPRLRPGDVVRVQTKVTEGDKTRLQAFEGTILSIRGSGPSCSFTVRREVGRFAVERIFPLYSPLITSVDIVQRQKVRRAKLYYLRHEGRRRVKDDEISMQRHVQEEGDKKRLAEEAKRRAEEKAEQEARAAERAAAAVEKAKAETTPESTGEKPAESPAADQA